MIRGSKRPLVPIRTPQDPIWRNYNSGRPAKAVGLEGLEHGQMALELLTHNGLEVLWESRHADAFDVLRNPLVGFVVLEVAVHGRSEIFV